MVRTLLEDAQDEYTAIHDEESPGEHCENCCDFEPEEPEERYGRYGYGYGRYGRRGYDYDDECGSDQECPQEECAGCECECWKTYKAGPGGTFSDTIGVAVVSVLQSGKDDQGSGKFEDAVARLIAVDTVLSDWIKEEVTACTEEDVDWDSLITEVGAEWLNLVVRLQPGAAELATVQSHMEKLRSLRDKAAEDNMDDVGILEHSDAAAALDKPWDDERLAEILLNGESPRSPSLAFLLRHFDSC